MMGRPLRLESFDLPGNAGELNVVIPEARLEEERLKAFDEGYRAGWDDSAAAHAEDQRHISAEFSASLQDMSFTYHEARNAMLGEMEDLLRGVVDKVLPETTRHSLGDMILRHVTSVVGELADVNVEIVVAPQNAELLRELIAQTLTMPLAVIEEDTLTEGQAFLRMGRVERKLDLDAVLEEIATAVADFFEETEPMELEHG